MFKSMTRNLTRSSLFTGLFLILCSQAHLSASDSVSAVMSPEKYEELFLDSVMGFYEVDDFEMFNQFIHRFCKASTEDQANEFIMKLNTRIFDKYIRAMRITCDYYSDGYQNSDQDDNTSQYDE